MTGALAAAAGSALGAWLAGSYVPNCPLFGSVIARGPREGKNVYLTFDDGPNPPTTERVLDALASAGAPAAFFMVGGSVLSYPETARRVREAGHAVGNHTQHHTKLHLCGPRRVWEEISEAHHSIEDATGEAPRAFRAPHGYRNPFVTSAARRFSYRVFGWSLGVWDSSRPGAEEIRARVRRGVRPGAIVLLHDGDGCELAGDRSQTAEALPGIIRDLRNAGYALRSPAELLER